MERLTYRTQNGMAFVNNNARPGIWHEAEEKLAAYEDSGLTPERAQELGQATQGGGEQEDTMKYSELNFRQKKAFKNIKYAADDLIGGLENGCLDNPEDSEEWRDHNNALKDHEYLVKEIYDMAITGYYDSGISGCNSSTEAYMKDIRFCGKEWLMNVVDLRVKKLGY